MDLTSFNGAFQWVIAHGYILMFFAMFIEGPIITSAASFASALGFFNPWIVFVLAFFGDVIPDAIYYWLGYWGGSALAKKFGHYFGLTGEKIKRIEELVGKHGGKTLIAMKLTPFAPLPGIMAVGAAKMRFQKFIAFIIGFTIPKVLFFMILGYYFGQMYSSVTKIIKDAGLILFAALVIILIIYFIYNRITPHLAKRIQKL
jgi:membrane protein DedA with SNARE-associated domain